MVHPLRSRIALFRHTASLVVILAVISLESAWAQSAWRPRSAPEARNHVHELVAGVHEAEMELEVGLRRSKILQMKRDVLRVAVADPSIVEFVPFGPREVEIIGKQTGSTTVTLWMEGPRDVAGALGPLLSMQVTVTRDTAVEDRRRLEYGELQQMINEMFPDSKIQLIPVADKLIVRGQARDEQEAAQIMAIIREKGTGIAPADGPGGFYGLGGGGRSLVSQGNAASPFPDGVELPQSSVISLLKVPGEKQVMLKVRIAELSRSAIRRLGADLNLDIGDVFFSSVLAGGGNLVTTGTFDGDSFDLVLEALSAQGSARILAEPNLVVLSGQPASFIAGGEFAVPTVVGVGGAQAATTSFKGYGTQLAFTPTVFDRDRIRLNVAPTFSTLNSAASVQGIFGLDTRSVTTTVDLREGQVLAIAGLLQEQQRGDVSKVPLLGDIPLVSQLFTNRSMTRDEKELIILVSPELVHPLEPEQAPQLLPGMEVTEPDDYEFFWKAQIEGRPDCNHRSTVWPTHRYRLTQSRQDYECQTASDRYYLSGSHGISE